MQIVDLGLFLLVAIVTGHYATRLRIEAERANRGSARMARSMPSRARLAAAKDASDIYDAIQQHLALLVGRSVMLFGPGTTESEAAERCAQGSCTDRGARCRARRRCAAARISRAG